MKKIVVFMLLFTMLWALPVCAEAADVGVLNAPSLLSAGGATIEGETVNVKIKDGKITARYLYKIRNGGDASSVIFSMPKANESSLLLKLNSVTVPRDFLKKAELLAECPGSKLPKFDRYYVWRLGLKGGEIASVEVYFEGKYAKGKTLSISLPQEKNNVEKYTGEAKFLFETGKMNPVDIGAFYIGEEKAPAGDTIESGKASWSGAGLFPKLVLKYKNTKEELGAMLIKSSYKYPRNIGAAYLAGDLETLKKLGEDYIKFPSAQDPKLNISYIKYILAEAAFSEENEIVFEKYLSETDYWKLGSDQLSSRMALMALEYSKKTSSNTTGQNTLEEFKTMKPKELERLRPILLEMGIIGENGQFLIGNADAPSTGEMTPSPTEAKANLEKQNANKVDKTTSAGTSIQNFMKKIQWKTIVGGVVIFLLGMATGYFIARRKMRGSGRHSRTVYIG